MGEADCMKWREKRTVACGPLKKSESNSLPCRIEPTQGEVTAKRRQSHECHGNADCRKVRRHFQLPHHIAHNLIMLVSHTSANVHAKPAFRTSSRGIEIPLLVPATHIDETL